MPEQLLATSANDHGLAVGQHGLLGKQNLYDHSVRVPFVAVGPGIAKGRKISAPIYYQDVMPTTLELAGLSKPDHVQFHSLMPLLTGKTDRAHYEAIYGAYLDLQRSVTHGDHKLLLYPKIKKVRLFDLKKDPNEMNDLAERTETLGLQKNLFARLLTLQAQTGDKLDLRAAYPALSPDIGQSN